MQRHFIILCFILFSSLSLLGQTKIDDIVSIEIPGIVTKGDTVTKEAEVLSYYSNNETDSYVVVRVAVMTEGKEVRNLPVDSASLLKIYRQLMPGHIATMNRKGFILKDSMQVKIKDYLAYRITFIDKQSSHQNAETLILSLNGIVYEILYSQVGQFVEINKNKFQESLKISESAKQIAERSEKWGFDNLYSLFVSVLVIMLGFYLKVKTDEQNKFTKRLWRLLIILGSLNFLMELYLIINYR